MDIAIIGAGIAGLACASEMHRHGHTVTLFDKSRGAGGRMSTRRIATPGGEASFDHGAQYFTVRDPDFGEVVGRWQKQGLVARWPQAGPDAWVGVPAMNTIVKAMAEPFDVRFGTPAAALERGEQGWTVIGQQSSFGPFDALIVAIPAEQAAPLLSLHDFDMAREALRARSQPCWTGMFVFDPPLDHQHGPIRDHGDLCWAVCNRAKPSRTGPQSWVVQAQPMWSRMHLESEPEQVVPQLLAKLALALDAELPTPVVAAAHRWRFAMSSATGDEAMWNGSLNLGVCGDWLLGPRVECAWLSGMALARRIVEGDDAASPGREVM